MPGLRLFAFGSNGSGQLGVGHNDDLDFPQAVPNLFAPVNQLAAGGNHTVILCSTGELMATGNNEDGRCGFPEHKELDRFRKIDRPPRHNGQIHGIKQVVATWSATIVLCTDGSVFVRGSGSSGELGLGPSVTLASTWRQIAIPCPRQTQVIRLASGMAHAIAIDSGNECYGWGKGRKGQLGEPTATHVWSPRKIGGISFGARVAACGREFSVILGERCKPEILLLGPNGNDRFGLRANVPSDLSDGIDFDSSWGSVFAVNSSGAMTGWGRNDHGQLPPSNLPTITAIAAGSEHVLAMSTDRDVFAWGWGEHGNCGSPTDSNGDVKGSCHKIVLPGLAVNVFAGCATSFVQIQEREQDPPE